MNNQVVMMMSWSVVILMMMFQLAGHSDCLVIKPDMMSGSGALAAAITKINNYFQQFSTLKTSGGPATSKITNQIQECLKGPNPLHPLPTSDIQLTNLVQKVTHITTVTHNEHCAQVIQHLEQECAKIKASPPPWCDHRSLPKKMLEALGELYLELATIEFHKSKSVSGMDDPKTKISAAIKAKSTLNDVLAHLNWKEDDLLGQKADAESLLKEYHTVTKLSWEDLNKKIQEAAKLKEMNDKFSGAKCGDKFERSPFVPLAIAKEGDITVIVAESQSKKVTIVCGPGKGGSGQVLINPPAQLVGNKEKPTGCTLAAKSNEVVLKLTVSVAEWKELAKAGLQFTKDPAAPKDC